MVKKGLSGKIMYHINVLVFSGNLLNTIKKQ